MFYELNVLSRMILQIQVELLIRAHDCYTLGCCVDGIAEVLVVARQWTNTLIRGKRYKLMVGIQLSVSPEVEGQGGRAITALAAASLPTGGLS